MPTKVYIISDTDLEHEWRRGLEQLRERWRMEHPQQRWRGGEVSPNWHESTNVENVGKRENGKKVY